MENMITGKTGAWEIVIGLEVHAQVSSKSKLFSGAKTEFGAEANTQVSLVDAAMPGMLPVLNEYCVTQAIRTGLGLSSVINNLSVFDRKNYFYADLPQGYQISQLYHPIVSGGHINITLKNGEIKTIGVTRLHLEQDAGKSLHDQHPLYSYIDLNRTGIALMEIVSEPDMRSAYEATEYVKALRSILRYLGSCDGDMEKGSLRCDANVSVRKLGDELGTRCEIKNINSFRNIARAIDYEATRQVEVLENGGVIQQETRLFDVVTGVTKMMRSKEDAHDYRYFPDPDLLPLIISDETIAQIKSSLPELPEQKKIRYMTEFGLSAYDASILSSDMLVAAYFEEVVTTNDPKLASNWISAELFAWLNKNNIAIDESKITPEKLSGLLALISDNTISGKIAKQVFEIMFETGADAADVVEKHGLVQVTDSSAIEQVIDEVMNSNLDKVAEYRSGKDKLFGFFVGQVMKLSGGKANPIMVNDLLLKKLK